MCRDDRNTIVLSSRDRIAGGSLDTFQVNIPNGIALKDVVLGSFIMPVTAGTEFIYIYIKELSYDVRSTSNDQATFIIPVEPTVTLAKFTVNGDFPQHLAFKETQRTSIFTIKVRGRNNSSLTPAGEWSLTLLYSN